jgi:hypothetical protein
MNNFQNTSSGAGMLKNLYPGKGPVAQMHEAHPQLAAIRKKRDLIGKKQTLQGAK